jgi:hypothetical protein
MDLEKLASKLIDIKEAIKDKVKWHKTRIRCDEENHEEYGVESENIQQNKVQEINFEISKIKRQIDIEVSIHRCNLLRSLYSIIIFPLIVICSVTCNLCVLACEGGEGSSCKMGFATKRAQSSTKASRAIVAATSRPLIH